MKRFIYILFSFSLIFSSCADRELETLTDEGCIVLTVSNSTMTKAPDNGTDYERELNTVHFFFYPQGRTDAPCVFYHKVDLKGSTTGSEKVTIYVVEDAINKIFPTDDPCEVFAIANLPDYLTPAADSHIFEDNSEYTTLDLLQKYILKLDDETNEDYVPSHDGVNKPFVMAGLGTAEKGFKKNAVGSISLRRAASKVTISVAIPEYIDKVPVVDNGAVKEIRMVPFPFEEDPNLETINAALHNGNYKGYLYSDVDDAVDSYFIASSKKKFTFSHYLDPVVDENGQVTTPKRRVYTCEVPFYTYAREWEKGAPDAAYMTFEMRWGAVESENAQPSYQKYFYQILINSADRSFEPNQWYDMFVNVGVIGSAVELTPIVIDQLTFFVLDWSDETSGVDHPDEDVVLENYTYLNVDTPELVLENVSTGYIKYNASHQIEYDVTSAYTYNNSGAITKQEDYTKVTKSNFTKSGSNTLIYEYDIPNNQYAPIYITLDIWLDLNGDKKFNEATEGEYIRHVQIVHYPAMYVVRDVSCLRSIYLNGHQSQEGSLNRYYLDARIRETDYPIGYAEGVRNFNNETIDGRQYANNTVNYSMFIINVTSFSSSDKFTAPVRNTDGSFKVGRGTSSAGGNPGFPTNQPDTTTYKYIIGDPRQRTSDLTLGGGDDVIDLWYTADAIYPVEGKTSRPLKYYYPTEYLGNSFQVVAPKFRIVSFNNASGKECTAAGAALRCASLQEDGYPAGRWRLPTIAEIQFIIQLQKAKAIQPVFTSGSSCYATASYGTTAQNTLDKARRITMSLQNDELNTEVRWNNIEYMSVRCVYDDWYWGSERTAKPNTGTKTNYARDYLGNEMYGDTYLFTWGDKEIIW